MITKEERLKAIAQISKSLAEERESGKITTNLSWELSRINYLSCMPDEWIIDNKMNFPEIDFTATNSQKKTGEKIVQGFVFAQCTKGMVHSKCPGQLTNDLNQVIAVCACSHHKRDSIESPNSRESTPGIKSFIYPQCSILHRCDLCPGSSLDEVDGHIISICTCPHHIKNAKE